MTDESDTEKSLDYKLHFAQKQAQKVKALKEAKALELLKARALAIARQETSTTNATTTDITVPPTRDEHHISSEDDDDIKPLSSRRTKGEKAKSSFDSDNETSCIPSSENLIVLESKSSSRSSTNAKPLKTESLEVSQSSPILKSIDPDKRRFFRPLADAIAASDAAQLGKILLRLCVEYPNTRAMVESLFADTSNEDVIASPPKLIRKISNYQAPQDSSSVIEITMTPLPPIGKQNKKLEEKQKSIAVAKSIKKVPPIPPIPTSAGTPVAAGEKRKREESLDTSIVSQKKSKPRSVIPTKSKLNGSSSDPKDGIPKPSISSSKSLNISEGSKLTTDKPVGSLLKPKPDRTSLDSLFDSDYSETELPSNTWKFLTPTNSLECTACKLKYRDSDRLSAHMRLEHVVRHVEGKTNKEPSTVPNPVKKKVN
ncbi:hypothetical protein EYC80_007317 [Monilinia laxa]|uniref:C2H2-type domain-containing protein n=1 Tax=Monilinia laxa TaxID=61186 RepID=A0A5N6JVU8_MONLA|nr:hypothetical protein EYC80_007317 [Monilinia laxa]